MLTENAFDTGAVTIHYVEGPSGGLPVVLLHGVMMRWQTFLTVIPQFTCQYHIYALDLRGHGRSAHAPGAYQIEDYAEDVIRFVRKQVGEPAVIVGLSLGGNIAVQVAASAPELVHSIVLEEPAFYFAPKERFEKHVFYQVLSTLYEFLTAKPTRDETRLKAKAILLRADPVSVETNTKAWSQIDPDLVNQLISHRTHAHFHIDELLPKISCPVLMLQGSLEQGAQLEDADVEVVVSLLAQGIHARVQGGGHNLHHTQPATYYQLVSDFLESL